MNHELEGNGVGIILRSSSYCFQSLRLVCSSSHELLILGISVRIFFIVFNR
jgi:hypothetical protein